MNENLEPTQAVEIIMNENLEYSKKNLSVKKKIILTLLILIPIFFISSIIIMAEVEKFSKYQTAVELYTSEKYDDAKYIFEALNSYRDSSEYIKKIDLNIQQIKQEVKRTDFYVTTILAKSALLYTEYGTKIKNTYSDFIDESAEALMDFQSDFSVSDEMENFNKKLNSVLSLINSYSSEHQEKQEELLSALDKQCNSKYTIFYVSKAREIIRELYIERISEIALAFNNDTLDNVSSADEFENILLSNTNQLMNLKKNMYVDNGFLETDIPEYEELSKEFLNQDNNN